MSDSQTPIFNEEINDGPQIDSYGRHRVSAPNVLFAAFFSNTNHPLLLNTAVVGAGSVAFNSTLGSARLSTSTGATDSIIVQTKKYLRYNPGVSYFLAMSGVMGSPKTNVRRRWGYFDATDGLFFEQTSAGLGVVVRTSTSGSPVDTRVEQANWNIDKMDGSKSESNPSGVLLDTSKHNLYIVDFVWQGAGRIRFGALIGGTIQYFHQIKNSNTLSAAFMKSPSRPGRVELTNTGVATASTMDIVCFSAVRESNDDPQQTYDFAASSGATKTTANSTTVALPVLSIRPKTTFNGLTNRVPIQLKDFDLLAVQDSVFVTVLINATLTGASFTSAGANSAAEFDISATAVSGGTTVFIGYVPGGGKGVSQLETLGDLLTLGLDIAGSVQDTVTIAVNKVNANSDCYAALRWSEFQ